MSEQHKHEHENTKAVINRLSRAIGHLESVKKMVEDGRDCSEILIQISAVLRKNPHSAGDSGLIRPPHENSINLTQITWNMLRNNSE